MLNHIITSKTRRDILKLFFLHPQEDFYVRKIVRDLSEEPSAVSRELNLLTTAKMLKREERLNKVIYTLNKSWEYYDEFVRIATHETSLVQQLRTNQSRLGKIKFLAVSTRYVRQVDIKEDEVYLLVVGTIVTPEVVAIVAESEKEFGREINYTIMTDEEFTFRKRNNDQFTWRFLRQPKIMLVGLEEDLMK